MPNPLFNMIMGGGLPQAPVQPQMSGGPQFQNPIQKANYIMQAMRNPAQFVRQQFPDIPDNIANDPNQILQYLQRTRNISNDQLNQIVNQFPRF